jgi:kumamolisin
MVRGTRWDFEEGGTWCDRTKSLQVSFWLAEKVPMVRKAALAMMGQPVGQRDYYRLERLRSEFSADIETVKSVLSFAKQHGLRVISGGDEQRLITLEVPPDQVVQLFGRDGAGAVSLSKRDFPEEKYVRNIIGVFGLDNRCQARPFSVPAEKAVLAQGPVSSYPPASYGFPNTLVGLPLTGMGQHVGVIAFGGSVTQDELASMQPGKRITAAPPQAITQADAQFKAETTMDVEIVFKCAPEVAVTVYSFDKTENGWVSGLHSILQSEVIPSVISISWGWPEMGGNPAIGFWSVAAIEAIEDLLAALALRGVTVVVSSGDSGASVFYPASSAYVLACGGTKFSAREEVVWSFGSHASGGGVSKMIPLPDWQRDAGIACEGVDVVTVTDKRCVPDVAAWAIYSSGAVLPCEGTSASAPLWAGLMALANEYLESQNSPAAGNINALLYDSRSGLSSGFTDIQVGNNSAQRGQPPFYVATRGWDACTGWGSPKAMVFIKTLASGGPDQLLVREASDGKG